MHPGNPKMWFTCLINEFPNTRVGPFERIMRWQRLNAPELVAKDEDLQKAIEKSGNSGAETQSRGGNSMGWTSTKVAAKVSCWRANNGLSRGLCRTKFQTFLFIYGLSLIGAFTYPIII